MAHSAAIPDIADIGPPGVNLSDLADLPGTLRLLRATGVLP